MKTKLGIIGCQSKHAEFFGAIFNRERLFPDFYVGAISPVDEPQRLPLVLSLTDIPEVLPSDELIESCGAVLITTRLGETHYGFAESCIKSGKPVFVDKPFTLSEDEALCLIKLSKSCGVPLLGGSTLCFLPEIEPLKQNAADCASALIRYKADPDSEFGGYSFYGSHLTDLCCALFDEEPLHVSSSRSGGCVTSVVSYKARNVVLESTPEHTAPEIVLARDGALSVTRLDDSACYRRCMEAFTRLISSGDAYGDMLRFARSVRLLAEINDNLLN